MEHTSRKRKITVGEALNLVNIHGANLQRAAEDLCSALLPAKEFSDETSAEVEKLEEVINSVRKNLNSIYTKNKQRKFRHYPEKLDETFFSASQSSLFNSQKSSEEFLSQLDSAHTSTQNEEQISASNEYAKQPITSKMDPKTRRRRVVSQREIFREWAKDLQCTTTQLAGLSYV